jgi:hypothetical protein
MNKLFLLIAILLCVPLVKAYNITDITGCTPIDNAGIYNLTADITNSVTTNCIFIQGTDVILDCQNHLIDSDGISGTNGIRISKSTETSVNVSVRNCRLSEWTYAGVYLENVADINLRNIISNSNVEYGLYLKHVQDFQAIGITANFNKVGFLTTILNGASYKNNHYWANTTALNNSQSGFQISSEGDPIDNVNYTYAYMTIKNSGLRAILNQYIGGIIIANSTFENNQAVVVEQPVSYITFYNNMFNDTGIISFIRSSSGNIWNRTLSSGLRIDRCYGALGGNFYTNSTNNSYSNTCVDIGNDGICDNYLNVSGLTPEQNNDWLPLSNHTQNMTCLKDEGSIYVLNLSADMPDCGLFVPDLGIYNYTYGTTQFITVYPICNFNYWLINGITTLNTTQISLNMTTNYNVTAYFGSSPILQNSSVGGGFSAPTDYYGKDISWLNPFFSGFFWVGIINIMIPAFAMFEMKKLNIQNGQMIAVGIFLLMFLAFLFAGLYPSYLWIPIIFGVSLISVQFGRKIFGGGG